MVSVTSNTQDGARLDIAAKWFMGGGGGCYEEPYLTSGSGPLTANTVSLPAIQATRKPEKCT